MYCKLSVLNINIIFASSVGQVEHALIVQLKFWRENTCRLKKNEEINQSNF